MTSKDFCVWLRGYLEALGDVGAELEIERIKKELEGVVDDTTPFISYRPIVRENLDHPYTRWYGPTCDGRTTSGG